jgi:chemotaxis protein methyltransferase CheR
LDIEIIGSDIDKHTLKKARSAVYDQRQVKDVPKRILLKYFKKEANQYHLSDEVKQGVTFNYTNLLDWRALRKYNSMDFVFCRNVLIYFGDGARKQVIDSIFDVLRPGGYIFLGHSESVAKISASFKLVKFKKSLTYRK